MWTNANLTFINVLQMLCAKMSLAAITARARMDTEVMEKRSVMKKFCFRMARTRMTIFFCPCRMVWHLPRSGTCCLGIFVITYCIFVAANGK